jgi:signal transduction histidine kinase
MNLTRRQSGGSQAIWPIVLLVSVAVLSPTACVLWFMNQAVQSERLAVRQRLAEAYRGRLGDAQQELLKYWKAKAAQLTPVKQAATPGELFARLVTTGVADSVVIYVENNRPVYPAIAGGKPRAQLVTAKSSDEAGSEGIDPRRTAPRFALGAGRSYDPAANTDAGANDASASDASVNDAGARIPSRTTQPYEPASDADWLVAEQLEQDSPAEAATEYAELARATADPRVAASALTAQARCLARLGQTAAAYDVLTGPLSAAKYKNACDAYGRLIQLDGQLQALLLPGAHGQVGYAQLLETLSNRVRDYATELPASQRRLFMHELQALSPEARFPTLAAEDLAAEYLDGIPLPVGTPALNLTPDGKLWRLLSSDGQVLALWTKPRGDAEMADALRRAVALSDVNITLEPAGVRRDAFLTCPAGPPLPGYELALFLTGPDPFAAAAHRQVVAYAWTAVIGLLVVAVAGGLLARVLARQMRLARLKNDLVATVSHELKTPLASMRVLIDTLAEGRCRSEGQVQDYYRLIASENQRLTRLIDNFLTFSRMERNKRSFELRTLGPAEVVQTAVECVGERFSSPDCQLDVEISPDLPALRGDRDALVTVLLNLLDNAYKYSERPKRVRLRAFAEDGQICLEVRDNGIGLSRRAQRRVFDRFYQVDQTLTRKAGGCGLGLSIVKFIVDAHGGTVSVDSEPGQGSTFTVRLRAEKTALAATAPP